MTFSTAALVVGICSLVLAAPGAARTTAPAHGAIVKDCLDNGRLDRHYRSADLAAAAKRLQPDVEQYSSCPGLIASQRALYVGRAGATGRKAVERDCVAHGALRRRYPAAQLRAALAGLSVDVADNTQCRGMISSQLSGWERSLAS
ncbi:MAG: hypothetical protein JWO74_2538 [Solirubrobacterales bacterium]|nr:hypothetical protein [Solirubrobacterales bacterium]